MATGRRQPVTDTMPTTGRSTVSNRPPGVAAGSGWRAATLAGGTARAAGRRRGGNHPAGTDGYTDEASTTNEGKSIMGERMLRGSRLGAVSYESDRNTELAPRQTREYLCARGHQFEVPFAVDAEVPMTWECKFDGTVARLVDGNEPEQKKAKPPPTHGAL